MATCYTTRAEKAKEKTMLISKIYMQETMHLKQQQEQHAGAGKKPTLLLHPAPGE
jgi:hypothetical protein